MMGTIMLSSSSVVSVGATQARDGDEELLSALIQGIVMGIPGLSVAIGVDDELVWTGTAGYSDILLFGPA
jgi:hypothetical protein